MKNLSVGILLLLLSVKCLAQKVNDFTSDNYVTHAFKNVFVEMPNYREVNSGSKLVVTYEGGMADRNARGF